MCDEKLNVECKKAVLTLRPTTTASRCASMALLSGHPSYKEVLDDVGIYTVDSCISCCCLPRWMSSGRRGEAFISQAGDNAFEVSMRERLLQIVTPKQGRGDTVTLAHPEGPHMQIQRKVWEGRNPSLELGECIEDAALHKRDSHTSNL